MIFGKKLMELWILVHFGRNFFQRHGALLNFHCTISTPRQKIQNLPFSQGWQRTHQLLYHLGHQRHPPGHVLCIPISILVEPSSPAQTFHPTHNKTRLSCFNVKTKLLWFKTSYFKLSKTRLLRSDYLGNLNLICLVSVCTKFQLPSMSRRGWKICCGGVSQVTTLPNLNSSFIELELGFGFDN